MVTLLTHEGGPGKALERLRKKLSGAEIMGESLVFNPGGNPDHSDLLPAGLEALLVEMAV